MLLVSLIGNPRTEDFARVKYGGLVDALAREMGEVELFDATLRGPWKWLNLLQTFHPDRLRWRERSYKNLSAWSLRSARVQAFQRSRLGRADACLQLGVMFDGCALGARLPTVIYTDYTAALSAAAPEAGRSPFTPAQRRKWIALERDVYHRAAAVCTRSELVRGSLIGAYGVPPEKVSVVGGGVNFHPLPDVPDRSGKSARTLLFIGKDFYRKGGDLLLRAFATLRPSHPGLALKLVTGGPVPTNLPMDGVQIIPPTWDRGAVAALYRAADLFVLPSRLETWGDVLLEAMAFGLPCVGVQGQAMEEIIEPGETGLLARPDDPSSLAEAIARLLDDASLRRRAGQAARQRVEERFTWPVVAKRLAGVIRASSFPSAPQE